MTVPLGLTAFTGFSSGGTRISNASGGAACSVTRMNRVTSSAPPGTWTGGPPGATSVPAWDVLVARALVETICVEIWSTLRERLKCSSTISLSFTFRVRGATITYLASYFGGSLSRLGVAGIAGVGALEETRLRIETAAA